MRKLGCVHRILHGRKLLRMQQFYTLIFLRNHNKFDHVFEEKIKGYPRSLVLLSEERGPPPHSFFSGPFHGLA